MSSYPCCMAARERENKLDDAARVRHYRSEPLPSAREAVVSTIRRNLRVGRLHAFKVISPSSQPANQPASQSANQPDRQPARQPGKQTANPPANLPRGPGGQGARAPGGQEARVPGCQGASQLGHQNASKTCTLSTKVRRKRVPLGRKSTSNRVGWRVEGVKIVYP